jgi:hypothetical protein
MVGVGKHDGWRPIEEAPSEVDVELFRDRQVRLLLRPALSVPAHRRRLGEFRHRNPPCGYAGEVEAVQSPSIAAKKLTVMHDGSP